MIKKYLCIAALILAANVSYSQSPVDEFNSGSVYDVFGIGHLNYSTSLRSSAMGIQGISLPGNYINNLNPAVRYQLPNTTFTLMFNYDMMKSSNATKSVNSSNANPLGVNIGIPFSQKNGLVMGLGFNPYSTISYNFQKSNVTNGINTIETYAGKGGVSQLNAGLSYAPIKGFNIGADYIFSFGNIKDLTYVNFQTAGVTNTTKIRENDFQSSGFRGGVVIDFEKLTNSRSVKDFYIGFFYESKLNLNSKTDGIFGSSLPNDTISISEGDVTIPSRMGFGISKKIGNRYLLSSDVLLQNWENFTVLGVVQSSYKTSMRAGLGVEIQPLDGGSGINKFPIRLGVFYENSYFKVNGQSVDRYGVSTGIGIPLSNYNSFDLAFTFSRRGNTDPGLVKEDMLSLSAGLNFGELWFIRRNNEK
ncbi:hypothetical protein BH10BAC5_BH10BAC5_05740 [soil metagenome]